jgi:hypothetical protein
MLIEGVLLVIGILFSGILLSVMGYQTASDSYVDINNKSTNYGSSELLEVKGSISGNVAFIRFSVDFTNLETNTTLKSATLTLDAVSIMWGFNGTICAGQVFGAWTESGITYDNQPDWEDNINAPSCVSGVGGTEQSGTFNLNVKSIVNNWISGEGNYGFAVYSSGAVISQFHSKEGSGLAPYLTVDYETGTGEDKEVIIKDDIETKDKTTKKKTDNDVTAMTALPFISWAWVLIIIGIILIIYGFVKR